MIEGFSYDAFFNRNVEYDGRSLIVNGSVRPDTYHSTQNFVSDPRSQQSLPRVSVGV